MPFWDELHWMARESGREPEARGWVEAAKRRDPGGIERLLDGVAARVGSGRAPPRSPRTTGARGTRSAPCATPA
jgi:hypothetical protein